MNMKSDIQLLKDVQPLQDVQPLLDIQPLQDIEVLQDVTPLGHATNYNPIQRQRKKQTDVADSLLDVLLGKNQRDALFEEVNMPSWIKDIPVLNVQAAVPALLYRNYMQPIIDAINGKKTVGEAGIAIGLNTLNELGEDLDVLSNIVKSQVSAAGGHIGLDTLGDSLGVNGKRVKYNYNTGNTLADIGLEIVSDPITWLTLGAGAVEVAGTKGVEAAVSATTKTATEVLSDTTAKTLNKAITKEVLKNGAKATAKEVMGHLTDDVIRAEILDVLGKNYQKIINNIIKETATSNGYRLFINASTVKGAAKTIDKTITEVATAMTPIGLAKYTGLSDKIAAGIKALTTEIKKKLYDDFDLSRVFAHGDSAAIETLSKDIYLKNQSMYSKIFKQNVKFFSDTQLDVTSLQRYLKKFLDTLSEEEMQVFEEAAFSDSNLLKEFYDYLSGASKKFNRYLSTVRNTEVLFNDDMSNLMTVASTGPYVILKTERQFKNAYHNATLKSMQEYVTKHSNNLEELYNYIDKTILDYQGVHYGLNNLDGYLAAIISDTKLDKNIRIDIINLLETSGVNLDSASRISNIINSKMKNKTNAIKKVLELTNNISLFESKDYKKLINKVNIKVNHETGKALNKVFADDMPAISKTKYGDIMDASYKNIKQAAKDLEIAIKENPALVKEQTDPNIVHAVDYIKNELRLRDVPNIKKTIKETDLVYDYIQKQKSDFLRKIKRVTTESQMDVLTNFNKALDNIAYTKKFFERTDRIFTHLYKDTTNAFELVSWYHDLNKSKKLLGNTLKSLNKYTGEIGVQLRSRVIQMLQTADYLNGTFIKDNVTNYLDNIYGLVWPQLSHRGMTNELIQYTHLSENPNTRMFLEQISNPESIYRKEYIPKLTEAFKKASLFEQAENLNKVVAQIDTTMNIIKLLESELPYDLDKATSDTLLNIVFDTIENHKNWTISDILTEDAMGIDELKPLKFSESTLSGRATDYVKSKRNRLYDSIHNALTHPGSKEIRNMLARNNITTDEIEPYLRSLLDEYISAQSKINYIDNVALASLYSLDTTTMLDLTLELKFSLAAYLGEMDVELYNIYDIASQDLQRFYKGIKLGVDEIQKINKKLYGPLSSKEAAEAIKKVAEQYNLYTASISSGMFTVKNVIPTYNNTNFIQDFKLAPNMLKGSNDEYMLLVDRLVAARDIVHETYKYKPEYIEDLRRTLITTYKRPDALFAPVNPKEYFKSLDAQHLLTWEVVTKGNLSTNNKTAFYAISTHYKHMNDVERYTISDTLSRIEAGLRNSRFTSAEDMGYYATIARETGAKEYANRVVKSNLKTTWHDLDDLLEDKDNVTLFIKQDIADYDYITKEIHSIENISERNAVKTFGPLNTIEDVSSVMGNSYGYEKGLYEDQIAEKIRRNTLLATQISTFNPKQLATYIYDNTDGALVFYNNNIVRTLNADKSVTWSGIPELFNFTKEELKEAGLKIQQDGDWYYVRLTDNRVHNTPYEFLRTSSPNEQLRKRFNKLIDKYYYRLNTPSNKVPSDLIVVETLNKDTWTKFIEEHLDFFGDTEEQKLYQKLTPQGNSSFFNKSFERLNLTVVGGYDAFNLWNQAYSDTFIPHSQQMSKNTLSGLTSMIARTNKINKYLSLFFNSDFRLDSPLMTKMFKDATDARIKKFFAEDAYKVAILKADKQGLPVVFEHAVTNRHSLGKAIAAGGILVSKDAYNAMRLIVNNRMMTDSLADIFRRVVPTTYKSMYLFTPGFLLRNAFDTLIYKNANELGGLEALPQVLKYENAASKAFQLHNKIQQEVFDITEGETFNKETLLEVLSKHSKDEVETYFLVDIFMESSASGSLSESLSIFLENYNKKGIDDIRPLWEKFYEDKILFGKQPYNPLSWTRNLNEHIEQTGRFGLFLASVDSGMPINKAIERVVKTHFDYNSVPDIVDICERIFWFSTFPLNNFSYYINGGLTKSPTMLKLLMDVQTASWNNGEYTYEELKKTKFLSYHALAGNIRIGNWIVKLSPSVFDFISLVTNPVGNIKDRLNPFLSAVINPKEIESLDLNPLQTQIRNWKKFKEGNPLPSVLSKIETQKWSKPLRKYYRRKNYSSSWTSYPKIKKPRYNKLYVYKSRVHRIDASVRKNHRNYVRKTAVFHQRIPRYTGRVSYIQWKY